MEVNKWLYTSFVLRQMTIVREVDSMNYLKHFSDNTLKDQLLLDMTLLIWTCQFDGKPFFSVCIFAFLTDKI